MPNDTFLINAKLVIPEIGVVPGGLAIRDGRVAELLPEGARPKGGEVIDAEGRYVLPGFLDPHVHYGLLPPLPDRMEAESAFAASGGITTLIRYFRRPESYLDTFPQQVALGAERHYQDFAHHLTLFNEPQVREMERYVREFGVTSFKVYMNLKGAAGKNVLMDLLVGQDRELTVADIDFDDGHLYDIFRTAASIQARVRVNVHAEDAEIVIRETERVKASGLEGLPAWSASRPGMSEAIAIQTVAYLSRQFGVPVYFPHIGSREAVDAMADVRAKGTNYYAETGPQYVALDTSSDCGVLAKVMPPVRTNEDVARVWSGIAEGVLTNFGSDHIAYTRAEKDPGSIWTTRPAFGGTGLILPVFLSEGVIAGRLTLRRLAEMGSYHVARAFHLYPRKGTLLPGADADFVIVDLERERTIRAKDLLSASDFSAYEGRTLKGDVVLTAVRGTVVYRDGKIVGRPGHGGYYRRFPTIERVASIA